MSRVSMKPSTAPFEQPTELFLLGGRYELTLQKKDYARLQGIRTAMAVPDSRAQAGR